MQDLRKIEARIRQSSGRRNVEAGLQSKIEDAQRVKDDKQKDVDKITAELEATDEKLKGAREELKAHDAMVRLLRTTYKYHSSGEVPHQGPRHHGPQRLDPPRLGPTRYLIVTNPTERRAGYT